MKVDPHNFAQTETIRAAARGRMLSSPCDPLFIADWLGVVMIHLEVNAGVLQAVTPFQLDLWNGRAFVSLVAFTLRGMRPRYGGRLGKLLFKPLAAHQFLNVRTYVQQDGEPGIHFLAEWLDNRLAVRLGPGTFGLPYRLGHITYENAVGARELHGRVKDARTGSALNYRAEVEAGPQDFSPCARGSLDEWLMERYTAFNCAGRRRRFFRVWHEPWLQTQIQLELGDRSLLADNWPFFREATLVGANHSPGVRDVWMGWSRGLRRENAGLIPQMARVSAGNEACQAVIERSV